VTTGRLVRAFQLVARIEYLLEHQRDRTFAFDEFGPLTIRPVGGTSWAPRSRPVRVNRPHRRVLIDIAAAIKHGIRTGALGQFDPISTELRATPSPDRDDTHPAQERRRVAPGSPPDLST
jgi:hypothetical protein